jgi:nucleoid-associated protein EbfC
MACGKAGETSLAPTLLALCPLLEIAMNILNMMKQAQELQGKMKAMQEELAAMTVDGQSGGGMVTVAMSGKGELRSVAIDPSLLAAAEKEILEDLLIAAHADAKAKVDAAYSERMQSATAGLPIPPGLKLF